MEKLGNFLHFTAAWYRLKAKPAFHVGLFSSLNTPPSLFMRVSLIYFKLSGCLVSMKFVCVCVGLVLNCKNIIDISGVKSIQKHQRATFPSSYRKGGSFITFVAADKSHAGEISLK